MSENFEFDEERAFELVKERIRSRMIVAGEFVESAAKALAPVDTGNLRASIKAELIGWNKVRIGTAVIYAAIHEFGGEIKPVKAGALTVPLNDEARRSSARDFPDLFLLKPRDGGAFLVRQRGDSLEFMYELQKSVFIPARPYLRPSIYNNKNQIKRIIGDAK